MNSNYPFIGDVFRQPNRYRTNGLADASNKAKEQGKRYFQFSNEVYDTTLMREGSYSCKPLCRCFELRIELAVPYADKDSAKAIGARWDADKRAWYVTGQCKQLASLARWARDVDRIYLNDNAIREYALARGASSDANNRLFVPDWYWIDGSLDEKVRRICYWLPREHPDFNEFKSDSDAALWLMTSTGYMPVDQYLPNEREYLLKLAQPGVDIYVFQDKQFSYFRHREWDKW